MERIQGALTDFQKFLISGIGAFSGILLDTIPFAAIVFFAVVVDCASAWHLGRRVKKAYPNKATGKFKTEYAMEIFFTFVYIYVLILLMHAVDKYILYMHSWHLVNYCAALFTIVTVISILENFSSCNEKLWAKVLQKFLNDKTKRHFDIDIEEIKKDCNNN